MTGDKNLEVPAGCASHSLYKRKTPRERPPPGAVQSALQSVGIVQGDQDPCGVGEWDAVYLGRADYLENGMERDWSFRDAVYENGEVIMVRREGFVWDCRVAHADGQDNGDRIPHPKEDARPAGLAQGMDRYLRRGAPRRNERLKELGEAGEGSAAGAGGPAPKM